MSRGGPIWVFRAAQKGESRAGPGYSGVSILIMLLLSSFDGCQHPTIAILFTLKTCRRLTASSSSFSNPPLCHRPVPPANQQTQSFRSFLSSVPKSPTPRHHMDTIAESSRTEHSTVVAADKPLLAQYSVLYRIMVCPSGPYCVSNHLPSISIATVATVRPNCTCNTTPLHSNPVARSP